jgi:hypothetical protein
MQQEAIMTTEDPIRLLCSLMQSSQYNIFILSENSLRESYMQPDTHLLHNVSCSNVTIIISEKLTVQLFFT